MVRLVLPLLITVAVVASLAAQQESTAATASLRKTLLSLTTQSQRWIDDNDTRSVQRITGHMGIVIDILATRGDSPEWKQALEPLRQAVKGLDAATRQGTKGAESTKKVEEVRKQVEALAAMTPSGKPMPAKAPAGVMKNFMYLLDSTLYDARTAADEGDLKTARLYDGSLTEFGGSLKTVKKRKSGHSRRTPSSKLRRQLPMRRPKTARSFASC